MILNFNSLLPAMIQMCVAIDILNNTIYMLELMIEL